MLNKIDISSGSKILDILSDVTSECEPSNSGRVYSIYIKDYLSGIKAHIKQELGAVIAPVQDVIGYAVVEKDTLIVMGKQIQDFSYSKEPHPICFSIDKYIRNDFPEWNYLINDGIFARDVESMGWIWHISPEKLKDYNVSKYGVTAPIRNNM